MPSTLVAPEVVVRTPLPPPVAPPPSRLARVRAVFDPDWLLNPAKVFPLAIRPTRAESAVA